MTKQNKPEQAEWEKEFDDNFMGMCGCGKPKEIHLLDHMENPWENGLLPVKNFIRNLLSKQEAEKKEAYAVGYSEGALETKINYRKEIKKLKQQHREDLESLKVPKQNEHRSFTGASINEEIDKLLNSKKKR